MPSTPTGRQRYDTLAIEGWTRSSKVEDFRDSMAGEVVLRELIAAFRDLPVTIDPQDKDVPKVGRSGEPAQVTLQRLLASPNADPVRHRLATMRSRFDSEYPSISNLAPLIGAGPDLIIIEPMSDETAFNNASPVGESEFSALKDTIANTGTPRRLKPLSINYHAYAGEYPALLRSVKDRLRAASQAALTPASSNRYAAIVEGFFSARVDRVGSAAWRISRRGELETVRFDAAEGRDVDLQSRVGVIGQRRNGRTLYDALDEAIEPAVVVLGPPAASRAGSPGFGLVESRWLVRHVVKDECALSFEAQGYGDGSFTWSDAASGRYTITVDRAGQEIWRRTYRSPIYVVGAVKTPGAYKHVPGMIVLHAVALADGLDRGENLSGMIEGVRETERLRSLTLQVKQLLARRSRLEAQRDGESTLPVPVQLANLARERTARTFLAAESTILRAEQARRLQQSREIALRVAAARNELDALKRKLDQVEIQKNIRTECLDDLQKLKDRGWMTSNNVAVAPDRPANALIRPAPLRAASRKHAGPDN